MTDLREFGRSVAGGVLERVGRGVSRVQERTPLAHDLLESDDDYLVVFDAPGAEATDVQVRYRDDTVEVRVDRFRAFHEGFETVFPGRGLSLSGSVALPADAVDADAAEATLTAAGELHVRVPKAGDVTDVAVSDRDDQESAAADSHDGGAADNAEDAVGVSADDEPADDEPSDT